MQQQLVARDLDKNLRSTEHEDCSSHLDSSFTREAIGNERRHQGSEEGTGGHRSCDTTLRARDRVIEVVFVRIGAEDTAHGRNIESEEHATYSEVSV